MDPQPWGVSWPDNIVRADTSMTPSLACGAANHDFARFDSARIYCRRCGDVRTVGEE